MVVFGEYHSFTWKVIQDILSTFFSCTHSQMPSNFGAQLETKSNLTLNFLLLTQKLGQSV